MFRANNSKIIIPDDSVTIASMISGEREDCNPGTCPIIKKYISASGRLKALKIRMIKNTSAEILIIFFKMPQPL
jgi:hypothetical protein